MDIRVCSWSTLEIRQIYYTIDLGGLAAILGSGTRGGVTGRKGGDVNCVLSGGGGINCAMGTNGE